MNELAVNAFLAIVLLAVLVWQVREAWLHPNDR